jgi:2'-5' RNA ligase
VTPAGKPVRLFFALWPDDAVRAALGDWSRAIQRVAGGLPTRAESIHLTLAFLGATDPGRRLDIEAAAGRIAVSPFDLTIDEAGYWNHNRIAWAGASTTPAALETLVRDLRAALTAAAVPFDPKPFVPHLTLVRKARPGLTLPGLGTVRWRVTAFVLVRSEPQAGGSRYAIAAQWPAPGNSGLPL